MPRLCPLGDLASSLVHLQRFCTRLRKVWRHKGPNSCNGVQSQASKRWAGKLSDEARWDGHVDGSIREGAAVLHFCSTSAVHPCMSTYTNVREADSSRGTFKKQTLKKSVVSCQIGFLSWLPRARDKQQAGPMERPGAGGKSRGWQLASAMGLGLGCRGQVGNYPTHLLPWSPKEPELVPGHPQRVGSLQVRKKCTAGRETLSHLGG